MLLVSSDCIQDEPFVGVWDVGVSIPLLVGQVQLTDDGVHLQAWLLHGHLHVDCLIWLYPDLQTLSELANLSSC